MLYTLRAAHLQPELLFRKEAFPTDRDLELTDKNGTSQEKQSLLNRTELFRLEKTSELIESHHQPSTAKSTIKPVPKCHIYKSFKSLQRW